MSDVIQTVKEKSHHVEVYPLQNNLLTHCGLGDFNEILAEYFSSQLEWLMAEILAVKLNVTRPYWWSVNIGSGNGLVPSGNKPLPEPMLTQICGHRVSLGHNELINQPIDNMDVADDLLPTPGHQQPHAVALPM